MAATLYSIAKCVLNGLPAIIIETRFLQNFSVSSQKQQFDNKHSWLYMMTPCHVGTCWDKEQAVMRHQLKQTRSATTKLYHSKYLLSFSSALSWNT